MEPLLVDVTTEQPPPARFAVHLPLKVEELGSHCSPAGELSAKPTEGALRRLKTPPPARFAVHLPLEGGGIGEPLLPRGGAPREAG